MTSENMTSENMTWVQKNIELKKLADETPDQFAERLTFFQKALPFTKDLNKAISLCMTWRNMKFLKSRYSYQVEQRVLLLDPLLIPHPPKPIKIPIKNPIKSNNTLYDKRKLYQLPKNTDETYQGKRRCYDNKVENQEIPKPIPRTMPRPFVYIVKK
jgi:hypothetical protein